MSSRSRPLILSILASPRKSPAMADGNREIEHGGGGFCSPIDEPASPTSYLVRDKHRREIQEEVDGYNEETSSDDLSEEAENNRARGSRKTLRELLNFDTGREELLSLLRKSSSRSKARCSPARNSTSTSGKPRPEQWQGECCKDFLLVQAVCGRKTTSRNQSPRISSSSRCSSSAAPAALSSSRRRCSSTTPSPLRNSDQVSMIRSKSSGLNSHACCEINLTKSKSFGAASYVVRADSIPKSGQQQQQQRRSSSSTLSPSFPSSTLASSRSGRKSSAAFTSSTCVMSSSPSDSLVSAMDRYQQRVKDEHRRQTSSYLPYKRALLSLFLPLPTFSSQQRTSHHHSNSTAVTFL